MATLETLMEIAHYVNAHEIGLPHQRAVLVAGGFVRIESIEVWPDGSVVHVYDSVESLAQARAVLGY